VTATIAGLSLAALAAVVYSLGTSDGDQLTRRAWARMVLLGASGLSLLPGCLTRKRPGGREVTVTCYARLSPDDSPPSGSLLAKWARLGKVWREMSAHLKRKPFDPEGEAEFKQLETEMKEALDALPAWPELRAVVEQRWAHIHRRQYVAATCYEMMVGGPPPARGAVEQQVKELEQLVGEGKLTKEAAQKAAEAIGVQAAYYVRLDQAEKQAGDDGPWEAWGELWKQYEAGEIVPGASAELAGQRLAELTVDDLGLLAGQPQEGEGLPPANR